MAKSKPFTVRLSPKIEQWLEAEAKRTKRAKGVLLEALADEAIRMRRFPGIAFRGPEYARRAWIIGTAQDVWEIIEAVRAMGYECLLQESDIPESKLRLALAYYEEYADEIDAAIDENRLPEEEWHRRYPSVIPAPAE